MADTRLITIVAGNQYYMSDPSIVSTQSSNIHYLDMSDADTLNPTYATFSNFGNIKTGFYDSYDVHLNINFKSQSLTSPELDAKEQRAAFVNDVVPKISQILVFPTGITGNAFSKSAKVKTVEMVDNSFVDGLQLSMTLELVGRWITPFSDLTTDTLTKLHVNQGDTHSDTLYLKNGTYTWEGTITNGVDSSPTFGDNSPLDMDNPFVFKVVNSNTQAVLQSQQVYNGNFSLSFSVSQAGFYLLIIDNKYNNDTENYWDSSDHTGGYYASNGYLTPPSSKAEISTVNYYAIDPTQPTTVACWATVPSNDSQWVAVVFYDVNKNVITRKAYSANTQTTTTKNYLYKINFLKAGSSGYNAIPAGAVSLRVSFRTWGSDYHLKIAINQADIVKFTPSPFEVSYYVPYDLDFRLMGSQSNLPAPINPPTNYGTNMLQGTGTASGDVSGGNGVFVQGGFNGYNAFKTNGAYMGRFINLKQALARTNAKPGDWYTISVYVKADTQINTGVLNVYRALGNVDASFNDGSLVAVSIQNQPITTQWQQYSWSFQINNISLQRENTRIEYNQSTGDNWIYWAGWMLEKGTVIHPWSLSPSDNVNIYPAKILPSNTNKWALVLSSSANINYIQLTLSNGNDTADLTINSPNTSGTIILTSDLLETKLQPLVISSKTINYVSASAVSVTSFNSTDMAAFLNMITNSQGTTTVTASNMVTGELVTIGFYEYDVKDFI